MSTTNKTTIFEEKIHQMCTDKPSWNFRTRILLKSQFTNPNETKPNQLATQNLKIKYAIKQNIWQHTHTHTHIYDNPICNWTKGCRNKNDIILFVMAASERVRSMT